MGDGGRVTRGKRRGIWKPSPGREETNSQVRIGAKELLERPEHLSTESQGEEMAGASEQGASNRAENSASLGVSEQYPAALPLRDQIKIVQDSTSSILHELLANSLHNQPRTEMRAGLLIP